MIKYALIRSLDPSIDKALAEMYKNTPRGIPQWASWETEITNIKQLYGVGGAYEVTVKVFPYYGPHIGNGIDERLQLELLLVVKKIIDDKHIHDV